jgi:hypothetical protein
MSEGQRTNLDSASILTVAQSIPDAPLSPEAAAPVAGASAGAGAPPGTTAPVPRGQGAQAGAPVVHLVALPAGESVVLEVWITGANDVAHVPFHLRYDPTVLAFESGEEGPFLAADGARTAFFASPTSTGGAVIVGLSRIGSVPGQTGDGLLCRFQFATRGTGETVVSFTSAKVRDSSNAIVPSVFEPLALVVAP